MELSLGHLRYHLTDVPPQPNSPSNSVKKRIIIINFLSVKENLGRNYKIYFLIIISNYYIL